MLIFKPGSVKEKGSCEFSFPLLWHHFTHLDLKHRYRPFCFSVTTSATHRKSVFSWFNPAPNVKRTHSKGDRAGVSWGLRWITRFSWNVYSAALSDVWMFASDPPQTGSADIDFYCLAPFPAAPTFLAALITMLSGAAVHSFVHSFIPELSRICPNHSK